jgi:spore maturation protein CgeB
MKILIFGTGELDCAAANCGIALRAMGHAVRHFDPDQHPSYLAAARRTWTGRKVLNRFLEVANAYSRTWQTALLREVDAFGPDLVLVIPISVVPPNVIRDLKRRTSARVAGWFQDHVVNFGRHEFLLADYDGLFFKDRYIVERLRDYAGLTNIHYLPESCEPTLHRPLPLSPADHERFDCDLMIYGSAYAYRARLVEGLLDHDLKYYTFNPGRWLAHPLRKKWQGFGVYYDEKVKAVLAAKVVINTAHFGEVHSVNARLFEVAGIGGFQVADAPGVAEFFAPGKEVVTFKGPSELRDVVEHYVRHPDERRVIAERARVRAHAEHTYRHRLMQLIDVLHRQPIGAPAGIG